MPNELLRVSSGIHWRWTVIRPRYGAFELETELYFEVDGRPFSLTFDSIPERTLLYQLSEVRCIAVHEVSYEERGWVERGRYRIVINDDDDGQDMATVTCDLVRWTPERPA